MARTTKIAIPLALVSLAVTILIWLSGRALATEHRLSCLEIEDKGISANIVDIKSDLKEIKSDIKKLLVERKEASFAGTR